MVIIDTSVVYKFFDPEKGQEQALNILQRHKNGEEIITVPDLLLFEIANAWSTKTNLNSFQISTNLNDLKDAELKVEKVNFELISDAMKFSREYKISVYDAYYAVLAQKKRCNLVTADDKFVKKVKLPFIIRLSDYE